MNKPEAISPAYDKRWFLSLAFIFAFSLTFLFARLGHYALWDDEAGTALSAVGIWETGDTTAVLGHNIVAYSKGKDLRDLRERYMPPLPAYLAAPFIGLLGQNSFAARLPFALCGAACVALMLWWIWKNKNFPFLLFFAAALLTNVSFFLFFRQCRYYALSILLPVVLAYIYLNWKGGRKSLFLFTFLSVCLFASNYLNYVALYICLGVDYFFWRRKQSKLRASDWLILLLPQLVVGGFIFSTWNPIERSLLVEPAVVANRFEFIWWCFRDINTCEFGIPALVLLGLLFYVRRNLSNPWLLRASVCLLVFVLATALLIPNPPSYRSVAAVRYFIPAIPLMLAIAALTLAELYLIKRWVAIALAVVAFSTNILNGGPFLTNDVRSLLLQRVVAGDGFQSTIFKFIGELANPPGDPYKVAADWINRNVAEKKSLWVLPDYATYPLMFHAPKPVYAWQLAWPPRDDFKGLPPIHFVGQTPPDYFICFGHGLQMAQSTLKAWNKPDFQYTQVATLDFFWKDLHRPELFWRTFQPVTDYSKTSEAIYIFQLEAAKNQNEADVTLP